MMTRLSQLKIPARLYAKESALWLAWIRIFFGAMWIQTGLVKLLNPNYAQAFLDAINRFHIGNPYPWYDSFLEGVVLPNYVAFGYLIAYAEFLIGLSFLVGLFVNLSAGGAAILTFNFLFAGGWLAPAVFTLNLNITVGLMVVVQILFIIAHSSKSFSLDILLSERYPSLRKFLRTGIVLGRDLMTKDVVVLHQGDTAFDAARLFSEHGIGSAVVLNDNKPVGIITAKDLVKKVVALGLPSDQVRISKIMSKSLLSAGPNVSIRELVRLMSERKVRAIPIVAGDRLVGIVTSTDIGRYLSGKKPESEPHPNPPDGLSGEG